MYKKHLFIKAIMIAFICWGETTACMKDRGNYVYSPVDTLIISNLNSLSVPLGGNPGIYPQFSSALGILDTSSDLYSYQWIAYNLTASSTTLQKIILDTTKNLDKQLPLTVGSYPVYYEVTQKSTGISWTKQFTLTVTGAFDKNGWFVLSQVGDSSQLDYYQDSSGAWNSYPHYYRKINELIKDATTGDYLPLPGKPLSLASYISRDYINTDQNKYYLYINTDRVTQMLNITDGFIWKEAKYLFTNQRVLPTMPRADFIIPCSAYGSMAFYDHSLYTYNYTGAVYYSSPVNKLSTGEILPVSDYVAAPTPGSSYYCMLFDTINKRFIRFGGSYSNKTSSLLSFPSGAFDPNTIDKNLVWLGWTAALGGQAVAILKDSAANNYYLARMTFTYTGTVAPISLTDVTSKFTGIAQADHFAIDQQYGYVFYTSNGKLYEYDMDNDIFKAAYSFNGKSVSMLKTQRLYSYTTISSSFLSNLTRFAPVGFSIIVGLYDPSNSDTSGEVHFLKPGALMSDVTEYFPPFTGMGRVTDVNYLED